MKFFYLLILSALLTSFVPANAQDSASCTARFGTSVSQNVAFFQAVDTQAGILHHWLFGDGSGTGLSSRYGMVSHTYASSGTYWVTHVIQDSLGRGCFDSSSQSISINVPPPCQISFLAMRDTFDFHVYSFFSTITASQGPDSVFWYVND